MPKSNNLNIPLEDYNNSSEKSEGSNYSLYNSGGIKKSNEVKIDKKMLDKKSQIEEYGKSEYSNHTKRDLI